MLLGHILEAAIEPANLTSVDANSSEYSIPIGTRAATPIRINNQCTGNIDLADSKIDAVLTLMTTRFVPDRVSVTRYMYLLPSELASNLLVSTVTLQLSSFF